MTQETLDQDIVYSLAASPTFEEDGICFAGRRSGLYRSEDGGRTWQDAYGTLDLDEPLPTPAVAVSPTFSKDRSVFSGAPGGILRSSDGGERWLIATLPSPPPFVTTLAISPNFVEDGVLLAGTMEDGIFRSGDRGQHWAAWNFGLLDLNVLSIAISPAFADDETIFASTDSGIFRSTNGGRAWRAVDFSPDLAPVLSLALSPSFGDDGSLFAGTEWHGLYRSDDRGATWTRLGPEAITDTVNDILISPRFPAEPDILVATSESLLVSRDGGSSWPEWDVDEGHGQGKTQRQSLRTGIATVAAPEGLGSDAMLLVGLTEGGVQRI